MSEPAKDKPPIEPLKNYVEGLGLPSLIILICAAAGAGLALWNGKGDAMFEWVRNGAFFGAFLSVFGALDMIGSLLGGSDRFMNGVYQGLGFLTVLAAAFVMLTVFA